jgi:hypothetical protein
VFRVEENGAWGEPGVVVEARRVLRGALVRLGVVLSAVGFVGVSWLLGSLSGWLAGHGPWAWAAAGGALVALVGAVWSEGGEVLASARQVGELAGCQRCQVVMVELAEGHREVAGCELARRRGLPLPGGHRGVA